MSVVAYGVYLAMIAAIITVIAFSSLFEMIYADLSSLFHRPSSRVPIAASAGIIPPFPRGSDNAISPVGDVTSGAQSEPSGSIGAERNC